MKSEFPFQLATWFVLLIVVPIIAYHRVRAASSGERISRKEEGYFFALTLRSAGLALWLATFAYLLFPVQFRWGQLALPHAVRWFGAVLGLLSALMMYWTLANLGKNLTDTVVTRQQATLVTSGPYRWVRHPFYVTAAWMMAAISLLSASWLIAMLSAIVLALLAIRTPHEEAQLIARFGPAYRNYMEKTGRYFPRF